MTEATERALRAVNDDDMATAAEWFARALRENPADIASRAWLGQCLCSIGRRFEGTPLLREAARQMVPAARAHGTAAPLLELIAELQHWSEFESAAEIAQEALRIEPDSAAVWQSLALSYGQLNRLAEARQAGERALALLPRNPAMQVFQASLEADDNALDAARARLDAALRAGLDERQSFRAHKELARIEDKAGNPDRVFPHLRAAASLAPRLPEYAEFDRASIPAIIEANAAGLDRALLSRWSGVNFSDRRPAPVFVLGFMRSGTTLTHTVLGAHPGVFVSDEADLVSAVLRELHRRDPSRLDTNTKLRRLDQAGVQALRQHYWTVAEQRYGAAALDGRVFVDKFTMNTVDLALINAIFPDARVIFVQRDPRDVCLSCIMQLMVPSPTTVQLLDWENAVRFYAQVMRWWLTLQPLLTLDWTELRYEEAVGAFEPTFRRIFAFIGVDWDAAVLEFHKQAAGRFISTPSRAQVSKPLYASSVARWRRYEAAFAPVRPVLAPFVDAFGYEPF